VSILTEPLTLTNPVVDFGEGYAGLTTVGYTLKNPDGSTTSGLAAPRTQSGVVDLGHGSYGFLWIPAAAWAGSITWDTGGSSPVFSEPEDVLVSGDIPGDPSEYTPTVAEVALLLRARTKDANGNDPGTFTDLTRPTGQEVTDIIQTVANELVDSVGVTDLGDRPSAARTVIALETAERIEAGYFPEELKEQQTAYAQFDALRKEKLRELYPLLIA
jgi:hypothetical protein